MLAEVAGDERRKPLVGHFAALESLADGRRGELAPARIELEPIDPRRMTSSGRLARRPGGRQRSERRWSERSGKHRGTTRLGVRWMEHTGVRIRNRGDLGDEVLLHGGASTALRSGSAAT